MQSKSGYLIHVPSQQENNRPHENSYLSTCIITQWTRKSSAEKGASREHGRDSPTFGSIDIESIDQRGTGNCLGNDTQIVTVEHGT
jgi:hypothetical protein